MSLDVSGYAYGMLFFENAFEWVKVFASEAEAVAFGRGLEEGASMFGGSVNFYVYGVPTHMERLERTEPDDQIDRALAAVNLARGPLEHL